MTLALPQKLSPTAIFCTFHHHMDWSTTCILKHSTLHNFPSCHSNTPPPTSLDPAVFDSFKPSAILVLSPSPPAGVHCVWLQLHLQQVKWIWLVYTATPRPPHELQHWVQDPLVISGVGTHCFTHQGSEAPASQPRKPFVFECFLLARNRLFLLIWNS